MKKYLLTLILILTPIFFSVKMPERYEIYVNRNLEIAQYYEKECGIPVSIQFAQAIAESGCGESGLGKKANNHFGMMAFPDWKGSVYNASNGTNWKIYKTLEDCYRDHAEFLNANYQHAIGKPASYWVNNCKGYGVGNYWKKLDDVIKMYDLTKYDNKQKIVKENVIEDWFIWSRS